MESAAGSIGGGLGSLHVRKDKTEARELASQIAAKGEEEQPGTGGECRRWAEGRRYGSQNGLQGTIKLGLVNM